MWTLTGLLLPRNTFLSKQPWLTKQSGMHPLELVPPVLRGEMVAALIAMRLSSWGKPSCAGASSSISRLSQTGHSPFPP